MSNIDLETIKQNVPDAWIPSLDSLIVKGSNAEIWDKDKYEASVAATLVDFGNLAEDVMGNQPQDESDEVS